MMEKQSVGSAAAAAAAESLSSRQKALRQHKEWLVNFRRDMNLIANVTDHQLLTAQQPVSAEQSSLVS